MLRRRSASNGIWATAEDLTQSAPLHDGEAPALSVAPDGRAVVALQSTQDGPDHVYAAVRESGSGSFGKLVPIGPEDALTSAPAATGIAPNGTAYVLYDVEATQPGGDHAGLVRAAPNASFTPPQRVSPLGVRDTRGQLAFSGNDAVAAWAGTSSGNEVVQGVHWSAASPSADDFRDLDAPSDSASIEDVEGDGDGGVEVLWSHKDLTSRVAAYDAGAPVAGDASAPADAVAGQPVPMKAAFTDRWSALDAAGPQWDFGDGASGSGTDVSHAYAQPGDYTVHVRSADVLGNARERTFPVHVTAVPSGPLPAGAAKPKVKLSAPTCAPKLRGQACRRFLVRRSTWKVLHGTASDAARVQVTVKRSGSTKARVLTAKLAGGRWVARTGGLKAGRTTFTVRAFGADGSASKPVTKKVRLR